MKDREDGGPSPLNSKATLCVASLYNIWLPPNIVSKPFHGLKIPVRFFTTPCGFDRKPYIRIVLSNIHA